MKKIIVYLFLIFSSFSLMSFGLVSNPKYAEKQSIIKKESAQIIKLEVPKVSENELINEEEDVTSFKNASLFDFFVLLFKSMFKVLVKIFSF